jgi:O-antigen chain-terminating methyltransferase
VEFNRHAIACVEATMQALNEANRTMVALSSRLDDLAARIDPVRDRGEEIAREFEDVRSHWTAWRQEWERKLFINETQFLRSVADLQGGFQHRATLMESTFRETARAQHADYLAALDRSTREMQERFWGEVVKARLEYERMIHEELRIVRQRSSAVPVTPAVPAPAIDMDYARFAERFRGSEEYVRNSVRVYLPYFQKRERVLDIGCGRGEFLELMRETGVDALGIDLGEDSIARCRQKGLSAERADLFDFLANSAAGEFDAMFCSQVVEHLRPDQAPELIRLASAKLRRHGLLAIETPNPECLAIFASHFYLDPTHQRPVPHPLLAFYLEEHGFGQIQVLKLSPAVESMPALTQLPAEFRDAFFGGLDYAILGLKL